MALGVTVTSRTSPPSRGVPVATDTWFVAAVTDVGTVNTAVEVRDITAFEQNFGPRAAGNILLWDSLDLYFREGGKKAVVTRGATGVGLTPALASFTDRFGPGQVSAIGYTVDATAATAIALWDHARLNNRVALVGVPTGTTTDAALNTYVDAIGDTSGGYGGVFAFDVVIPGAAGVVGASPRTMSPVPVIAALCARVDETGNPNQAAAGRWLPLQYATDLAEQLTKANQETALNAGVNYFANVYGVLENYGFQTPVAQSASTPFWQLNCSRTRMALVARAKEIGEQFMFRPIDGQGQLTGSLKGALDSMMLEFYGQGALYGQTPSEAFYVDTGSGVNTPATIAQGKLRAAAAVVLSLHAKAVEIELLSIPVGGGTASPQGAGTLSVTPTVALEDEDEEPQADQKKSSRKADKE